MSRTLSRRTALRGSLAASLGFVAGVATVQAAPILSANDRRLVAIAAELLNIDTQANALDIDAPGYDALIDRYGPLVSEMEQLPSDTMAGVMAKARTLDIQAVAFCQNGIGDSIAADLRALHAAGRLAHA